MSDERNSSSPILSNFDRFFDDHYDAVRCFMARRIGSEHAEDLAEEVFALVLRRHEAFDASKGSPRSWVFGIAHNVLRHHRRAEARRLRGLALLASASAVRDVCMMDEANARVDAARLQAALATGLVRLPRGQRDVLLLHAWADLTDQEISAALEIPLGTVRSRLSRARNRLREHVHSQRAITD